MDESPPQPLYSLVAGMDYSKPVQCLQLTLSSGLVTMESYHLVSNYRWNPDGTYMSLNMCGTPYHCQGEQLLRLVPYFRNRCLHHLYCYDPDRHELDPLSPIIHTIAEAL